MSRNFFHKYWFQNLWKNVFKDNNEKSWSLSRNRVSHKKDFIAVCPRIGHADSVGVNKAKWLREGKEGEFFSNSTGARHLSLIALIAVIASHPIITGASAWSHPSRTGDLCCVVLPKLLNSISKIFPKFQNINQT